MPVIEKKRTRDLPQINERIRFPKIRVIDTDGAQLGIITPQEAIQLAEEKELDLVLISDKADPPVCRIMDYGKYKFEQEKKAFFTIFTNLSPASTSKANTSLPSNLVLLQNGLVLNLVYPALTH